MASSNRILENIEKSQQILEVKKFKLLEKMISGENPNEIIKAQQVLNNIQTRETSERKSFLLDPLSFNDSFGYKDKPTSLSYMMLKNMAKTPIINAIIKTRINQVSAFATPQTDRYSLGYEIRKKCRIGVIGKDKKELTDIEKREIEYIVEFLENCGRNKSWEADDFDGFIRKITRDSLVYDQMTFEIVRDRKGLPYEFFAVDGSTIRIADSYDDDTYKKYGHTSSNRKAIKGYYPNYVQVYQQQIREEFYPWELCCGIRNPNTDIYLNGYGVGELEELTSVVTSMLWSDDYNRRFFKQGSAPKGILRVSGSLSESKIQEFRQQWNSTMRGVYNSWKTPIMEADKIDWVDLTKTNREMEFSKWMEYLIKLSCAIYSIDPAEVNFPLSGGANQQSLFEGNNEARLKHSRDKGLSPLLKFLQKRINKWLVDQFFDGKYEFVFKGIDSKTPKDEIDQDSALVRTTKTVNEIRREKGMDDIEGGDIILDGVYVNAMQMAKQNEAMNSQGEDESEQNPITTEEEEENPISKAFNTFITKLNIEE